MESDGKKPGRGSGWSRRDFLQGSAAGALATGLVADGLTTEAEAASGGLVGPDPLPMSFRINGRAHTATLEPRVTLLDALRWHAGRSVDGNNPYADARVSKRGR